MLKLLFIFLFSLNCFAQGAEKGGNNLDYNYELLADEIFQNGCSGVKDLSLDDRVVLCDNLKRKKTFLQPYVYHTIQKCCQFGQ